VAASVLSRCLEATACSGAASVLSRCLEAIACSGAASVLSRCLEAIACSGAASVAASVLSRCLEAIACSGAASVLSRCLEAIACSGAGLLMHVLSMNHPSCYMVQDLSALVVEIDHQHFQRAHLGSRNHKHNTLQNMVRLHQMKFVILKAALYGVAPFSSSSMF
jgi:hypothetical protein